MEKKNLIELQNVAKHYAMGENIVKALDLINIKIDEGDFVAIMGPSGSGKCVVGETEIILDDGTTAKIREFGGKSHAKVFSISKKGKIEPFKISNFYQRTTNKILEVKTSSGKLIQVTKEHPFFTITEKGFSEIRAIHLKGGMFIATPEKLNVVGISQYLDSFEKLSKDKSLIVYNSVDIIKELKKRLSRKNICKKLGFNLGTYDSWAIKNNIPLHNFKKIINECKKDLKEYEEKIKLTALSSHHSVKIPVFTSSELMEIYGYLAGDGNLDEYGIKITNYEKEINKRVEYLINKIFGLKCKKFIEGRIDCNIKVLRSFFNLVFEFPLIKKSRNIKVPEFVFRCPDKEIATFIRGLFDCDSHVSKNKKEINITLASSELIKQLGILFLRFGIHTRYKERIKYASNTKNKLRRKYYSLSIPGHKNLKLYKEKIGFNSRKKNIRLNAHLLKKEGTNIDVIPCGKFLREIRKKSGISLPRKIHKLLWSYEKEKINPSIGKLNKIIKELKKRKIDTKLLDELAKKEIFWDKIVSVKNFNKRKIVYDITIPKANNYVANGIIIHNSTGMNLIGSLDYPTQGDIYLDGENIKDLSESELAQIRGKKIGFIFQQFNLIPNLTAKENVMLPMLFQGEEKQEREEKAKELLELVDLKDRMNHYPNQLSGGQQQRVSIARSLANNPDVILADEPTGNLDTKNGEKVMEFLQELNKKGKTIIIVTHEPEIAKNNARTIYFIKDGRVEYIEKKTSKGWKKIKVSN